MLYAHFCGKLMRMSSGTVEKKSAPTYKPVGYIDLLRRNRSFRQLWLGQVVSQMGDWFNTIALYTMILNLTGSGRDVGLLLVELSVWSTFGCGR